MPDALVMSFGHVHGRRAREVMGALSLLLSLARGSMRGCDAGFRRESQGLLAVMHLELPVRRELVARLAFWCARAGGLALTLSEATEATRAHVAEALGASDVRVSLAPARLAEGLAELAAAAGAPAPPEPEPGAAPVLALSAGGPGWEAVTYDPAARRLFVPSPLSPPRGDRFELRLDRAGGSPSCSGRVRTVAVCDPFEPAGRGPAGFVLAVEDGRGLHAALAGDCARDPEPGGRTAPRLRVGGRARLGAPAAPAADASFVDVSHRGAFLRTRAALPPGTAVRVGVPLPHGERVELPATVVHGTPDGIGVAFGGDPAGRAALDAAVAGITASPPRVLVVDDDPLARELLGDALAGRGFAVVAEQDALAGLLRLAEEIFTLDVLVTDVVMPEVDGVELIRRIREVGGERDLPIVVVSGNEDPALAARLRRCGADAVLPKRLGPEAIADAVVKVGRRARAAAPARGDRAPDGAACR